ncbi:MAG: hypothetical protein EOM50_00325 [Erysipelotrichia bacterium]|nr:hypothetical protein [Erysipelotrichia bacterium]
MKIKDKTLNIENIYFKVIAFDNERYEKNKRRHLYYKIKCKRCGEIFSRKKEAITNNFEKLKCRNCVHTRFGKSLNIILYNIFRSYTQNAKSRKIPWNLTEENFKEIITKPCTYCGDSYKKTENITYSGIDRIDSKEGYNINNCVPCCKICNMMKNNLSVDMFLSKIKQIHNRKLESSTTISKESTLQVNGNGNRELLNASR